MTATTTVRSATQMEKARSRAIGLSAFLVVLMLTIAITFTAISLRPKKTNNPDPAPGGDDVQAPIAFTLPVSGSYTMLKGYSSTALQFNQTLNRWESHKSVSIGAAAGTAVLAAYDGKVKSVEYNALNGTVVTIEHRDDLVTVYSSLDRNVVVSSGDLVSKGQKIGTVGTTSSIEFTDTPHVRVEVYKNSKKVNPADYIDFAKK